MCALFLLLGWLILWQWVQDNFRLPAREKLATAVDADVSKTKHTILPFIAWNHGLLELMDSLHVVQLPQDNDEVATTQGVKGLTQQQQHRD